MQSRLTKRCEVSNMRGLFTSKPRSGKVYAAHRSDKAGRRMIWYVLPHVPALSNEAARLDSPECIEAADVPKSIREIGYRWLAGDWSNGIHTRHKRMLRLQSNIQLQSAAGPINHKPVHRPAAAPKAPT